MKNSTENKKYKKILSIIITIIIAAVLCLVLYYLIDYVWNGSFVEWFEEHFMIMENRYDPVNRSEIIAQVPLWYKIKKLLLYLLIGMTILWIISLYITAHFTSGKSRQKCITEASRLIHLYMNNSADIAGIFPPEYAEIAAEMAEIKTAVQRSEQSLQTEASRRNDLVAYLAHDLKTPLTSVIGYLSLLEEAPDMPAEQKAKYLHIAIDKAYRLEKMINEFFEITRYNLQQISIEKKTIDLYYMLVQLSDELSPVLSANGNSVLLKADENLTIEADPDQLARVFNNILKNAAAYSFPNTEIIISAEEKDISVIISFQNEGRNIPQEKLSMIFEKFYRLDDARTSSKGGTGLGLAIAREIITLHDGSITASSENDTVTFIITLPAVHRANVAQEIH